MNFKYLPIKYIKIKYKILVWKNVCVSKVQKDVQYKLILHLVIWQPKYGRDFVEQGVQIKSVV